MILQKFKFIASLLFFKPLVWAFDPVSLGIAGGTALIEGLTSLFDNSEEEQRKRLKQVLDRRRGQIEGDYSTTVANINRTAEMAKKQRRGISSSVNSSQGITDPTGIYAAEEDVVNSQLMGIAQAEEYKNQEMRNLSNQELEMEALPPVEGGASRFFGGLLGGANTGLKIADAFGFLKNVSGGTKDTTKTLDTGSKNTTTTDITKTDASNINSNWSSKLESKLSQSVGNLWGENEKPYSEVSLDGINKNLFGEIMKNYNPYRLKNPQDYENEIWRIK